jgi:hypothetical protein
MLPTRIAQIAYHQDDLITRAQALAAGATVDMLRHAYGPGGRWQAVLPGVYATFTGPLGEVHRLRAALLRGGPNAMITGATACRLAGLEYVPQTGVIDILVHRRRQCVSLDFAVLNRTNRMPEPWFWIGSDDLDAGLQAAGDNADELAGAARRWNIPMAPLPRAAMDAARILRTRAIAEYGGGLPKLVRRTLLRDTRALLCEVVQRRRCTTADLLAELAAGPRRGTAIARLALDDVDAGCHSAPECELRDLIKRSRVLPEPRWNRPLPGLAADARPMIRPDACWPEARLVVEVNSVAWHRIGAGPERTEARQARLAALGWRVLPVSPHRIRTAPHEVRREIESAYRAGLGA